jgi:hypothetical protein
MCKFGPARISDNGLLSSNWGVIFIFPLILPPKHNLLLMKRRSQSPAIEGANNLRPLEDLQRGFKSTRSRDDVCPCYCMFIVILCSYLGLEREADLPSKQSYQTSEGLLHTKCQRVYKMGRRLCISYDREWHKHVTSEFLFCCISSAFPPLNWQWTIYAVCEEHQRYQHTCWRFALYFSVMCSSFRTSQWAEDYHFLGLSVTQS